MAIFGTGLGAEFTAGAGSQAAEIEAATAGVRNADGNVDIEQMLVAQKSLLDYGISVSAATNGIKGEGDPFKDTARNLGG